MSKIDIESGIGDVVIPGHLHNWKASAYERKNIDYLRVGLKVNGVIQYIKIFETPHFKLAKQLIENKLNVSVTKYDYIKYIHNAEQNDHSFEQYVALLGDIKSSGYNSKLYPILVYSKIFDFVTLNSKIRYVLDGFHRLAILTALGENEITVCKLQKI